MSELFTLSCWIRGDDTEGIFNIKISPNEEIGAVKQKIKDCDSDTFGDVAPKSLRLYKLNAPVPFDGLSAITLSTSGKPLTNALRISDVFATQPHRYHIHLIVGTSLRYKVAPAVHPDFQIIR
ncbi:hypothetical protein HD554DRAFT_1269969 [Boletus coccyginus]|nr:hypothetical protein HD554DRAFT_1269969 [Boletus coccyginus]